MNGSRTLSTLLSAAILLPTLFGMARADDREHYLGRPLVSVLQELQETGLDLIFSSAVVTDDLVVSVEPVSDEPRSLLNEILEPLGLQADDGPGGSILILPRRERPEGKIVGRVLRVNSATPIAGAVIRVPGPTLEATSGEDGSFEVVEVPHGMYQLFVEATGYSPTSVTRVRVPSRSPLIVHLRDQPAFSTEVVVTPGRHSVQRAEQIAARTIDQDDMVLVPSIGGDVSRIIERLPGVASADSSAAFNVRGSLAADTSMVFDGLELYDPFHLQSFQAPFSLIDSQVVDRVEFLGGGQTAEYGDRHGAFIEVSTLTPASQHHGELEIGTLNSRVSYGSPISEGRGSWLLTVRGWYPQAMQDAMELGGGERFRPSLGDAYAKLSWSFSARTLVSAHGLFGSDRLSFVETDEDVNESVDATTDSRYLWVRVLNSVSSKLSTDTVVSGGLIDRTRGGVSAPDDGVVTVNDDRTVEFLGLTSDVGWQISRSHMLKAGLYARRLQAKYRYENLMQEDPDLSTRLALDPEGTSLGLYVAHRARVSSTLSTELGLRWDQQDYTNDNQVSPRFNLFWQADDRTELRFAIGRFQQSQRIHELRVEDGETAFLPAEASEQVELTIQHRFAEAMRFRFDAYYRELSDLRPRYENLFEPIELFPETSVDRLQLAPDGARLRGVELLLSYGGSSPLSWWVSYVLSSAEDVIDGRYVPRSWDQTQAARFLVGYRWKNRWFVSLTGTAHTGWPTTPVTGEAVVDDDGMTEIEPVVGERNSIRFPTYARLDLRARRSFDLKRSRLSLTLDVLNFTDRKNVCCVDEFMFRPGVGGPVTRTEYDYWLGFTPAFSILWEF